uniref:Uncharacterized protein n=1 Tax=Amphiprion percula TaxID=161767 RepID=A0A3P8TDD8_AMPPE
QVLHAACIHAVPAAVHIQRHTQSKYPQTESETLRSTVWRFPHGAFCRMSEIVIASVDIGCSLSKNAHCVILLSYK